MNRPNIIDRVDGVLQIAPMSVVTLTRVLSSSYEWTRTAVKELERQGSVRAVGWERPRGIRRRILWGRAQGNDSIERESLTKGAA